MSRISFFGLAFALLVATSLAPGGPAWAADVSIELEAAGGFSVKNSGASVERFRVDEATGNVSRNGALFVHTTGTNNLFVGEGAGNLSTTGAGLNSAFGKDALTSITTGHSNSAFGWRALLNNTTSSSNAKRGFLD